MDFVKFYSKAVLVTVKEMCDAIATKVSNGQVVTYFWPYSVQYTYPGIQYGKCVQPQ